MEVSRSSGGKIAGATRSNVRLSHMKSFFSDASAIEKRMKENPLIYSIHEMRKEGLSYATTILYPGRIGKEFFMTRGHAHTSRSPEIYNVISGKGMLICEYSRFEYATLAKGMIAYVHGNMRHRMVNIGRTPFIFLAIYATEAGHDYSYVEAFGFSRIVVAKKGGWGLVRRVGKKV